MRRFSYAIKEPTANIKEGAQCWAHMDFSFLRRPRRLSHGHPSYWIYIKFHKERHNYFLSHYSLLCMIARLSAGRRSSDAPKLHQGKQNDKLGTFIIKLTLCYGIVCAFVRRDFYTEFFSLYWVFMCFLVESPHCLHTTHNIPFPYTIV